MKQAFALALLALALLTAPARADEPAPFLGVEGLDPFQEADRDAGRLERLAGVGRVLARTAPIAWGRIEADPVNRPRAYVWKTVDEAVLLWQLSGFDPVLVLSPQNAWMTKPEGWRSDWHRKLADTLSKPEAEAAARSARGCRPLGRNHWPLWERFVRAFVERYDGDGKEDMPGLRRPVRHVQVMGRVVSPDDWLGSPDEYLRLLHHAGLGAKSAHGKTRVITAALSLWATGHAPYPDRREWDYRIARLAPADAPLARLEVDRAFAFARRILESPLLYDAVAHGGSASHADDVSNVSFLRRYLDENGGRDTAVWLIESPTRKLGSARTPSVVRPRTAEQRLRSRWVPPALNAAHSQHAKAIAWMRRGQALDLVRGACLARASGADVVCLRAAWDVKGEHQGLVAEGRTPSWYALRQAVRLLGGHRSAASSSLGAPGRAVVFTFDEENARPWVSVLLLDERLSWAGSPGEALPRRAVSVPLPNGAYVLESCRLGESEPARREVAVTGGSLEVELTPAPLYVIPKR